VFEVTMCKQRTGSLQVLQDGAIARIELRVDDAALPAKPAPVSTIFAIALDRELRLQPVRLAQIKVVLAMIGRHMDKAGAAVSGNKIAGQEGAGAEKEFSKR
jgi:hypothetical protein